MSQDKDIDVKPAFKTVINTNKFQSRGPVNIRAVPTKLAITPADSIKRKTSISDSVAAKYSLNDFATIQMPSFRVDRLVDSHARATPNSIKVKDTTTVPPKQRIVKISSKPISASLNIHNSFHSIVTPQKSSLSRVSSSPFSNDKNDVPTMSTDRIRRPCNCTKSRCLKLYCECYANGMYCQNCNCTGCHNNEDYDSERSQAIQSLLARNPLAFKPKVTVSKDESKLKGGCTCKRSSCLRNYCECYARGMSCSAYCGCDDCRNSEFKLLRKFSANPLDFPRLNLRAQVLKNDVALSNLATCADSFWNGCSYNELLDGSVVERIRDCLIARLETDYCERDLIREFSDCLLYAKERFIDRNCTKL